MTLSQKHNLEKAAERFLAGAIERNAICSTARARGRSCEEEGEKPLINSICFANVRVAREGVMGTE